MKVMHKNTYFFLPFLIALLAACMVSNAPAPTELMQPTQTVTFLPTSTSRPAPTHTPRFTSTFTPTALFTLNQEQKDTQHIAIVNLLESNGECELPCWWGSIPGQTTWETTGNHLFNKGIFAFGSSSNNILPGYLTFSVVDSYFRGNGLLQTIIEYHISYGDVDYISENSYSLNDKQAYFKELWSYYAPENLIPILGVPTRVEIYNSFSPGEGPITGENFSLFIFYDNKGILLNYSMRTALGAVNTICPSFANGGNTDNDISIIIKSEDDQTPIENYHEAFSRSIGNMAQSLEESAGITLDDFYNLFLQSNRTPCFNVTTEF